MNKIGILTHHYVHNYGAILQAYAQARLLNAEIIDYRFKNVFDMQNNGSNRSKIFENFINNELFLSQNKLISMDYNAGIEFISNYEKIIVGSDEVWKLAAGAYSKPYPNIYWLNPELKCKKITIAASANRLDYNKLNVAILNDIQKKLEAFDLIGVRDDHTMEFIRKFGLEAIKVPDPALVYNYKNIDIKIENDKPKLGLKLPKSIMNTSYFKELLSLFKNHYIYGISSKHIYANENLDCIHPFEWANMFKYMDFVIANSFHCLVFSLKYGIPVLIIDDVEYKGKKSKTYDLLKDLDMLYCHTNIWEANDPVEKINYIKDNFDKNKITEKLNKMKQKYFDFVEKI